MNENTLANLNAWQAKASPAYLAAYRASGDASRAFALAQAAYRSRRIGDAEYLAARKVHAEAQAAFDVAYLAEQNREGAQ